MQFYYYCWPQKCACWEVKVFSRIPCGLVDDNVATSIQRWKKFCCFFLLRFFALLNFFFFLYVDSFTMNIQKMICVWIFFFSSSYVYFNFKYPEDDVEKLGLYFITFIHTSMCINIVVLFLFIFAHLQYIELYTDVGSKKNCYSLFKICVC